MLLHVCRRLGQVGFENDGTALRPFHFEGVDFLGADIAGEQRRVIGGKPKPVPKVHSGQSSYIADVCYLFDLTIAQSKADDVERESHESRNLKIEIFPVPRPVR